MTAIPALIDIGPALIAFFPEVIEYPTPTAVSFSKNTWFVDAPPTGAEGGRLVKLAPLPEKDVAVITPALPSFILLPTSTKSPNVPVVPEIFPVTSPVTAPTNVVAVTTPAFPSFIILPTSIDAAERPDECRFDEPVLKLDAEDIPVILR